MRSSKKNKETRSVFDVHASRERRSLLDFFKDIFYKRNQLNLRSKFRVRHPLLTSFIVLVMIFGILTGLERFFVRAQVNDFYPESCLGTWRNPEQAIGKPDNLRMQNVGFDASNSSVFATGDAQVFCGSFLPADYVPTGNITSVGLTLVWNIRAASTTSSDNTNYSSSTPINVSTTTGSDVPVEVIATTTSSTAATGTDIATTSIITTSTPENVMLVATSTTSTIDTPSATGTMDVAPPPSPTVQSSSTSFLWIPIAFADEVTMSDTTTVDAATSTSSGTIELGPPLTATLVPVPTSTATSGDALDVVVNGANATDTVATDSVPLNGSTTISNPAPDEHFLKVSYSTDGATWIELTKVNLLNWQNLTVTLPVSKWDDLAKLSVKIEGIPTTQDPLPVVYLDGMLVEVHYDGPLPQDATPHVEQLVTDKISYQAGEIVHVTGAADKSSIEIYALDDPNTPGIPANTYSIEVIPGGTADIDSGTLAPGRYILVDTLDTDACSGYTLAQCEARSDYIGELPITVVGGN